MEQPHVEHHEVSEEEKERVRRLLSETARMHEGKIPKGSDAAQLQSKLDAEETAKSREEQERVIVRGVMESHGDRPMEAIDPKLTGKPIPVGEAAIREEDARLQQRYDATKQELVKQPHLATFDE